MTEQAKKCTECGGATHPIRVMSRAGPAVQHQLVYAAENAKPGWLLGNYAVEGELAAELCEGCGRVTFRAVPRT